MRALKVLLMLMVCLPAIASAQSFAPSFSIQAAAGPTVVETGHTISAAVGFSPWSRVTFLLDVQRTQQNSRIRRTQTPGYSSVSTFRGGTMTAVSGEVRVALFPPNRLTPYVLAGVGRGESRPTVNADFPSPVKNDTGFIFFGGGVHMPLWNRLSAFGDFRMLAGVEGNDSMIVMYPVRAGIAWRF